MVFLSTVAQTRGVGCPAETGRRKEEEEEEEEGGLGIFFVLSPQYATQLEKDTGLLAEKETEGKLDGLIFKAGRLYFFYSRESGGKAQVSEPRGAAARTQRDRKSRPKVKITHTNKPR